MYHVTKELEFCCAHRLVDHKGKCKNIHGHNYVVKVSLKGHNLDDLGMVVDFKNIKKMQSWLDDNWDHKLILSIYDPIAIALSEVGIMESGRNIMEGSIVEVSWNPTAENMAKHLYELAVGMFSEILVDKVEVYETPTSMATYDGEE